MWHLWETGDMYTGFWWEDHIKMELEAGGWRGMGWIDLAQDRDKGWALVNAVMNFWVP